MSYEKVLEYIHSVGWRGSRLGLERTRLLLKKLGNPEKQLKFIHIAGTNGKGSTAACLASILRCAGYRTGLYTSPYIHRFNERICVDGTPISDAELEQITWMVRPYAESMEDLPTEFEIITAIAMCYFVQRNCEIVVLETGLGGEKDSTNVIETPEAAVITAMGMDHTRELGETMTEIASAKAGIIKEGGETVIYGGAAEADAVFETVCRVRHNTLYRLHQEEVLISSMTMDGSVFCYGNYRDVHLPLAGSYQPYNAALAIETVQSLRRRGWQISDQAVRNGLETVYWPGRFEVIRRNPLMVLDGAHNVHGIHAAVESLGEIFGTEKKVFVVGVMADKNVPDMMRALVKLGERFFTVTPQNPRAMKAENLACLIHDLGGSVQSCTTIQEGVWHALTYAEKNSGIVCALGSLYFSADVRQAAQQYESKNEKK